MEELESKSSGTSEKVAKLTNDLTELTEKLEDIKESFETKDSGINDTSPLVRIKAGLQQIKSEINAFDLRIGVVSHSLLAARIASANRRRITGAENARKRHGKGRKDVDDDSVLSADEE
jgi:Intra-flagellar transport protein 57